MSEKICNSLHLTRVGKGPIFLIAMAIILFLYSPGTSHAYEGAISFDDFPWVTATWTDDNILIRLNGITAGSYELYTLETPDRIVIDIDSLTCSEETATQDAYDFESWSILRQLRVSCSPERTRIVLESDYPLYWEITSDRMDSHLDINVLTRFRQTVEQFGIDDGTQYIARRYVQTNGQRYVHAIISNPEISRLRPGMLLTSDILPRNLASLNTLVEESRSVAGINGGYFMWPGISLSLVVQHGAIISPPQLHRPAFMVLEDGQYIMDYPPVKAHVESSSGLEWDVDVVNQSPTYGQMALLTPGHPSRLRDEMTGQVAIINDSVVEAVTFGEVEDFSNRYILWSRRITQSLSFLSAGEEIEIELYIDDSIGNITDAMQGGPFLVKNGVVDVTSEEDDIGNDIANGRSARTAIGIDDYNRIFLVVVEGSRKGRSIGSTLEELAWTMLDLGATWAINLDGGSSSGIALGYNATESGLVNGARSIASAIVLIDESGQFQSDDFHF